MTRQYFAALCAIAAGLPGLAAGPKIERFWPHGVAASGRVVLTFHGSGVETASRLWTSFGAETRRLDGTNGQVRFEVACTNKTPGVGAVQLYGPGGGSDYRLVLIDALPAQPRTEAPHSVTNSLPLTIPAAFDGTLQNERADLFQFNAKAGERIAIEAIAHRIGSEADPVLRVLEPGGAELAFCDDEPGVWRDARFVFHARLDGAYLIEAHDAGYGGGANFFYRLRLTREPLTWWSFPLREPDEELVPFQVATSDSPPSAPAPVCSPADPPGISGLSTGMAMAEREPNDSPAAAQPFQWPGTLHGLLQRGDDVDFFSFHAAKGDCVIFQSATRRLGSPCDLVLRICERDGNTLASSDPKSAADAAVTNKFLADGDYVLEVRELTGQSPPRAPYRISAALFEPGVSARTENSRLELSPGGSTEVKISLARFDYAGEVSFRIDPPIPGLALQPNTIGTNKNDGEIRFTASSPLQPGDLVHFRLRVLAGGLRAGGVSTSPALKQSFPLLLHPPGELEGLFSLAIKQ